MKIQDQTRLAKLFTESLLNFIVHNNTNQLNKDGKGCSVDSIQIYYGTDRTVVTVKFSANDENVSSFVCSATKLG